MSLKINLKAFIKPKSMIGFFDYDFSINILNEHFNTESLKGSELIYENSIVTAGVCLHYIKETITIIFFILTQSLELIMSQIFGLINSRLKGI